MSLLDHILNWATTQLKLWQRDAIRRLFQKHDLEQQDFEDLYAMLRSAHGLPDPQNRKPVPLAKEHLPAQSAGTPPVILRALRDLKHVNRIAPGQSLNFAPSGITIIYGGNASGKSGYSRVLKRACRARDLSETIYPDAFDAGAAAKVPEAKFDIEVGGKVTPLAWKQGETPPDQLSTVSVFDGRCARAYLDTEQDVAYLPYGLDTVESLGQRVLPTLSKYLNAELNAINTDTTPFADLLGDTAVGKMVASLSAFSDVKKIRNLATLTETETTRLMELDKSLTESDPKARAKDLRLLAQRIDGLISRIETAVAWVNETAVEKIKACDMEAEAASKAEAIAAAEFRAGETLLNGTGEQVWKDLFDAARRFSTGIAYPEKPFPYVSDDSRCPLCQQTFDDDASKRMQRFEDFVKQNTSKIASVKREQRQNAKQKIKFAALGFSLDTAMTEEIKQMDTGLLESIQEFEKKVEERRAWMLAAAEAHVWEVAPLLDSDPRPKLKALSISLVTKATDFDKAGDEEQRKRLEAERAEFRARLNLSPRLKAVLDLIGRMQVKAKLTKCKSDLKTKAISDKAKEFANQAVTEALKNALNTEFQGLGVGHIKTKLNERVEQGKMKHKLLLDLPLTRRLDEILSEGEQRAIAIGSFLAELHLANHKGGIVFDDPVSSLDHHWRNKVAWRLVAEAKTRQVIVLTHDTAFLGDLRDAIEQQNVNHLMHHLEWLDGFPGCVSDGLPWEHQSYKDRIDKHEKAQREIERTWPAYPNADDRARMRHEYDLLRATIERVIQDVVFNGVIQRYRDWIRVGNLDGVAGLSRSECCEISRLHKVCCDFVDAHDPPSPKNAPVPDAKQLGKDIEDLEAFIAGIKVRRRRCGGANVPARP